MSNPMNDLWRAQHEAAARMTESWSTLLQPAADRTVRPPEPTEVDDATEELVGTHPEVGEDTDVVADHDDETVAPEPEPEPEPAVVNAIQALRALGDGQRDLAEHMTGWARQQRDLADAMTAWATRQRDSADALDRVLDAFPTGAVARPARR